mmetsp:Transcript_11657/g.43831  ORF Transcript_11657/g.43831 Transcript_11657/m.43831 type:complete len:91 (+) Transcript_11657:2443-2715(+)
MGWKVEQRGGVRNSILGKEWLRSGQWRKGCCGDFLQKFQTVTVSLTTLKITLTQQINHLIPSSFAHSNWFHPHTLAHVVRTPQRTLDSSC